MQFSHDLKKKKKQLVTCFRQNLPRIKNLGAALFSIKPCQNNLVSKGGGPIHANVPLITPPPLLLAFVTLMMRPGCCNEGSGHYLWKCVRVFQGGGGKWKIVFSLVEAALHRQTATDQ